MSGSAATKAKLARRLKKKKKEKESGGRKPAGVDQTPEYEKPKKKGPSRSPGFSEMEYAD